jgi:hypothetical protein
MYIDAFRTSIIELDATSLQHHPLTSIVSNHDGTAFTPLTESKYTKIYSSKCSQRDLLDDWRREYRYEK